MPTALSEKILPHRRSRASKAKTTRDIVGACADLLGTSAAAADVAGSSRSDVAAVSTSDVAASSSVRAVLTSMDGRKKGGAWSIEEDLALLSARQQLLDAGAEVGTLERACSVTRVSVCRDMLVPPTHAVGPSCLLYRWRLCGARKNLLTWN